MKKENHLENFAELNPYPVIELDLSGKIVYTNLAARLQFPDLVSRAFSHPLLEDLHKIIRDFDGRKKSEMVVYNREIFFKNTCYEQQFLRMPNTGIYIFLIDVSERNQLKTQAHFNDKLATIGKLSAGIVHEINNPLTWILGNLSILQNYADSLKDYIDKVSLACQETELNKKLEMLHSLPNRKIQDVGNKLHSVIGSALQGVMRVRDISRGLKGLAYIEQAKLAPVNLHDILEVALSMASFEVQNKARIEKNFSPDMPLFLSNEGKLNQVFLNLLINAAQAIPKGDLKNNSISVTTQVDQQRVRIDITDTGTGISPDILPRIFDPFFTTKPAGVGSGLGLSVCHDLVKDLGGEIAVQSTPGKGTTFSIYLPIQQEVAAKKAEPIPAREVQDKRILVVDNEPSLLKLLHLILSKKHEVTTALGGKAAMDVFSKTATPFDLIISDLNMPDVRGEELYDFVVKQQPDFEKRFIFITGGLDLPAVKDFITKTKSPTLEKPFTPKEVLAVVDRAFSH